MSEFVLSLGVLDVVGLIGFFILAGKYFLVCAGHLNSSHLFYYVSTGVGAGCVLAGLTGDFNLGALLVQGLNFSLSAAVIVVRFWPAHRRSRAV